MLLLKDVLNPDGMLRLTGDDLQFDPVQGNGECVLAGTQSGRTAQSRFGKVENSEIILIPDIPAQANPWNNEYQIAIATHYTENGTLRTGIYRRKLRTPLTVERMGHPNPPEVGILTDKAAAPYVNVTGGTLSADETVRIQALLEHDGSLSISLLDMNEDGRTGTAAKVTANGPVTLGGFSGSALTSLNLSVSNFADLVKMIRSGYSGRVVDVLELKMA